VRIERFVPIERESPLTLTLAQAIAASDAMDSALRKATELGVAAVQPLVTARSAPMPDGERGEKRVAHWRQVVAAAAEQSGRNRFPKSRAPRAFAEWIAEWPEPASCSCRKHRSLSAPLRRRQARSPS
jgi:16S rRNA (uracil1498-N3)-methyltransferase